MLTLVYGGCCSGKSTFSEQLLQDSAGVLERWYIATMWPEGPDAQRRIQRHRALRATKGFVNCERYTDIGGLVIPEHSAALLECLGGLVANEMFQQDGAKEAAQTAILEGVASLAAQTEHLIVVSNEVGNDSNSYNETTQAYQLVLAALNRELCALSDCTVEMVCGIPVYLKGETLRYAKDEDRSCLISEDTCRYSKD